MKKLIFTALLIFPVFLNSGTLPLPCASELTIPRETAIHERRTHLDECPKLPQFHCPTAVSYAKTCNPLMQLHVCKHTLRTKTTRDGKTLLQMILKSNRGTPELKTALCCFLIKKGVNFNRDLKQIILHNDIELFNYMIYKVETVYYSNIIGHLNTNKNSLSKKFLYESTLIIHDLIKRGKKGSPWTQKNHPQLAAELVTTIQNDTQLLTDEEYKIIRNSVFYHYGPWTTKAIAKPMTEYSLEELCVYVSDYIASKRFLDVQYKDVDYE